jgi:hypothetical protein
MAGVQRDFAPLLRKLNDERRTFLRRQPPSSGTDRRERIRLRDPSFNSTTRATGSGISLSFGGTLPDLRKCDSRRHVPPAFDGSGGRMRGR